MPHADSSLVPADITTKPAFYAHIHAALLSLLEGHRFWVSNLAQAASLLYHAFAGSALYGLDGPGAPVVNWAGFYIHPPSTASASTVPAKPLVLGPYHGRPACITITPTAGRGVCADAFVKAEGIVVSDVEAYPGHIACDGDTRSEIVVPLRMGGRVVGVLDLDSVRPAMFDDDDLRGLQGVVRILDGASDWA
ncbi:hypothetical protein Q5752_004485 [Cryptotrichosporon argae]